MLVVLTIFWCCTLVHVDSNALYFLFWMHSVSPLIAAGHCDSLEVLVDLIIDAYIMDDTCVVVMYMIDKICVFVMYIRYILCPLFFKKRRSLSQ